MWQSFVKVHGVFSLNEGFVLVMEGMVVIFDNILYLVLIFSSMQPHKGKCACRSRNICLTWLRCFGIEPESRALNSIP